MKKILIILTALSMLTACEKKSDISLSRVETKDTVSVELTTIDTTESATLDDLVPGEDTVYFDVAPHEEIFYNIDSFISYAESDRMTDDFTGIYESDGSPKSFDDFEPCIPAYDESKYTLQEIRLIRSSYEYIFKNNETGDIFDFSVMFDTYYHTFEEMVESANANLVADVENNTVTVWEDTPALIQSVQFSLPVYYSIQAMIDENNCIYFSNPDMTPEELTACLNDFIFE